jgi:GNAT superfamily N-acetyltransferase
VSELKLENTFTCEALDEANAPELARLFERLESSCFCAYWHFGDDKNAWLARLAFEPETNRRELLERAKSPLAGVVATIESGAVIGWMKCEPARALTKIYAQRPFRGLPGLEPARPGVWTIGCFLVDTRFRRHGVARALLRRGVELLRAEHARAIEAFPRRAAGVRDEELWTGPFSLFESEGFYTVHDQLQYPVLRRDL